MRRRPSICQRQQSRRTSKSCGAASAHCLARSSPWRKEFKRSRQRTTVCERKSRPLKLGCSQRPREAMALPATIVAEVRQRAKSACEYCGVSEADSGGQLTIDHYQPTAHGGSDDLSNLLYCCYRCN